MNLRSPKTTCQTYGRYVIWRRLNPERRTAMTRQSIPTPTVGVFLVAVGSLVLLSDFGLDLAGSIWSYWPLIVIAVGMTKVMEPRHPGERAQGIWVGIAGLWLLVSTLGVY